MSPDCISIRHISLELEFAVKDMSTNKKKEARILLQDSRDDVQASFRNFIVVK
jgi:hypothetical protein